MFPPDPLEPRALVNRPGLVFDPLRLSNLYAEDVNDISNHVVQIEEYLLTEPWGGGVPDVDEPLYIEDNKIKMYFTRQFMNG